MAGIEKKEVGPNSGRSWFRGEYEFHERLSASFVIYAATEGDACKDLALFCESDHGQRLGFSTPDDGSFDPLIQPIEEAEGRYLDRAHKGVPTSVIPWTIHYSPVEFTDGVVTAPSSVAEAMAIPSDPSQTAA